MQVRIAFVLGLINPVAAAAAAAPVSRAWQVQHTAHASLKQM